MSGRPSQRRQRPSLVDMCVPAPTAQPAAVGISTNVGRRQASDGRARPDEASTLGERRADAAHAARRITLVGNPRFRGTSIPLVSDSLTSRSYQPIRASGAPVIRWTQPSLGARKSSSRGTLPALGRRLERPDQATREPAGMIDGSVSPTGTTGRQRCRRRACPPSSTISRTRGSQNARRPPVRMPSVVARRAHTASETSRSRTPSRVTGSVRLFLGVELPDRERHEDLGQGPQEAVRVGEPISQVSLRGCRAATAGVAPMIAAGFPVRTDRQAGRGPNRWAM